MAIENTGYIEPLPVEIWKSMTGQGNNLSGYFSGGNSALNKGVFESPESAMAYLRQMAYNGDKDAMDRLFNYYMNLMSENSARAWTASREDSTYQRLAADLQKAGFNPAVMFQGLSGGQASSASRASYSGNYLGSSARTDDNNFTKVLTKIIPLLVSALGVAMVIG